MSSSSQKIPKLVIPRHVVKGTQEEPAPGTKLFNSDHSQKLTTYGEDFEPDGSLLFTLTDILSSLAIHLYHEIKFYIEAYCFDRLKVQRNRCYMFSATSMSVVDKKRDLIRLLLAHHDLWTKVAKIIIWSPWLRESAASQVIS